MRRVGLQLGLDRGLGAATGRCCRPGGWSSCPRTSTWPRRSAAPDRRCRPPGSRRSTFFTPASFSFSPAALPAIVSLWPTWVIAPNSFHLSRPELIVMTGTPAETAALMLVLEAVGVGHRDDETVGARRRRRCRSACACLPASGSRLVLQVDAVVLAGLLGAGLDDVPERVARGAVGDHVDADVARRGACSPWTCRRSDYCCRCYRIP